MRANLRYVQGWTFLGWKKPADGGKAAVYKVERRDRAAGDWTLVIVAIESEVTLNNQERGKVISMMNHDTSSPGEVGVGDLL